MRYQTLFDSISELVLCHSPSGAEDEIDDYLKSKLDDANVEYRQDEAGNIIAKIQGKDSTKAIAITAHKDEIGGIVKTIRLDGKLEIRKLGGSFPWVYGEGVVDLLGDNEVINGVLSFGSRHVSHESPQKVQQEEKALRWEDAWVDTKRTKQNLEEAGIRPGTRMVVGKHRKNPARIQDYIASYTLDNKASVAILLTLLKELESPAVDVYLVASAQEEVGAIGAMYFTRNQKVDALIALEICPKSAEYYLESDIAPVLLSQDGYGPYSEKLNRQVVKAAQNANMPIQFAVLSQFGSDGSITMKSGHVPQAACLSFPTDNTHGFEIAHLEALENCIAILKELCASYQST